MSSFRQFRDGNKLVIHGDSLSLPGDLDFLTAPPDSGVPNTDNVHIFANEVSIHGTCYNAGADVNITCRLLTLDDGAAFDLSAPDQADIPADLGVAAQGKKGLGGKAGERGHDAGSLRILCGKVVKLGQLAESSSESIETLVARPDVLQEAVLENLGELTVRPDGTLVRPAGPAWLVVRAVGGKGGTGQGGQDGGSGAPGTKGQTIKEKKDVGKMKKETYRKRVRYEVIDHYKERCRGGHGGNGKKGGAGGGGGDGGKGGQVRFAVADGAYLAPDSSTPEDEWSKAVFMYTTQLEGGPGGNPGSPGRGGSKGTKGEPGRFDINVKWRWDVSNGADKNMVESQEGTGNQGRDGEDGNQGEKASGGAQGEDGSGPDSGESFEESVLVEMLNVDHLLRLERAAGKAWLNNDASGRVLARQFLFIKDLASLAATLPTFDGADDEQLEGVVEGCGVSLDRLCGGSNYFGFPPGFVPRTTLETISKRIFNTLRLATTVEQQVETFLGDITSQGDRKEALAGKIALTKQDLIDKRRTLVELNSNIADLREDLAERQTTIVMEWEGNAELGMPGVINLSQQFTQALVNWEPPSEGGPDWLKIGLAIGGSVVAIALTGGAAAIAYSGAAAAAATSTGAAVATTAVRIEQAKIVAEALFDVVDEGISVDPEIIIPAPITQNMSDTAREIQLEMIDRAVESAGGGEDKNIVSLANALKDGMRLWLDKCQERNRIIQEVHEMVNTSKQIRVDIKRLEVLVKRINTQINMNNIDPNAQVSVEFMESALEDQQSYLMRELFREHAKLVGIGVLPPKDTFVASSGHTVADLSVMHDRYQRIWYGYQDNLVQLSTSFKATIDLPDQVVRDLARDQMAEFTFSELPAVIDMLTDIVVNEVSVHVGEGALTPAAQVTAGILCMDKGSARAGLSCFDTKHNTDVLVAKMVGQGNEGAKLEGTIWTINLRYSTNSTGIYFDKLTEAGVQVIVSGTAAAPSVQGAIESSVPIKTLDDAPLNKHGATLHNLGPKDKAEIGA